MSSSEDPFNALCCPITLSVMVDPVICTGDGHTYEREAISNWFKEHNTSPMSGEEVSNGCMLIPNHALRNAIQEFRERIGSSMSAAAPASARGGTVARLGSTVVNLDRAESKRDEGKEEEGGNLRKEVEEEEAKDEAKGEAGTQRRSSWWGRKKSVNEFPTTNHTYSKGIGNAKFTENTLKALGGGEAIGTFALMEKKKNARERALSDRSTEKGLEVEGVNVGYGIALGGSEREVEERRLLAQRRTRDHIVVAGKPLTGGSSLGTSGIFQHIQPYPTHLSHDEDPRVTAAGVNVLSCSGATQFPGLLATCGMGKQVKLWIHRPLEDQGLAKKNKKKENGRKFSLSSFMRRSTENDEDLDFKGSGGFWENFEELNGSKDWLNDVKFSDDADLVLAGGRAGSMHLWKSPMMGPLAGEWSNISNIQKAHEGGEFNAGVVKSVALHPSKHWAYSGGMDWDLKAWDIKDGEGLTNGRVLGSGSNKHSAPINDIAVSDHNSLIATCGDDGRCLIWDERCQEGGSCITSLQVSNKPCSGCMFQPFGINGGGNWIITSDKEGCIKVWDLRKWELSRVIYDSQKIHKGETYGGASANWEGGKKIDIFMDVQISSEGWVCAVTEPGYLYTWDPAKDWIMSRQPTRVKASSLTISRVLA